MKPKGLVHMLSSRAFKDSLLQHQQLYTSLATRMTPCREDVPKGLLERPLLKMAEEIIYLRRFQLLVRRSPREGKQRRGGGAPKGLKIFSFPFHHNPI